MTQPCKINLSMPSSSVKSVRMLGRIKEISIGYTNGFKGNIADNLEEGMSY